MLGRIIFAWLKGTQLDSNAKKWRLFADVTNDIALCLEIVAPLTGEYFSLVACVAGVCKSVVGVSGGATRAAITQHQAKRNNMADVSAKDGSQETLVNLAAMASSLCLLPAISGHFNLILILFVLLTIGHVYANYMAVRSLHMESLNQSRLHLIMEQFLLTGSVPTVEYVNLREPIFWQWANNHWTIKLGASVSTVLGKLVELKSIYSDLNTKYLLHVDRVNHSITILLCPGVKESDQLQACIQAEMIMFFNTYPMEQTRLGITYLGDVEPMWSDDVGLLRQTYKATETLLIKLIPALSAKGWNCDLCNLAGNEWRVQWNVADKTLIQDKRA